MGLVSSCRDLSLLLLLTVPVFSLLECKAETPPEKVTANFNRNAPVFKPNHWYLRHLYNLGGMATQFRGFLQFNQRRRPSSTASIRHRFGHKCRSWPPKTRTFDGFCNNWHRPRTGAAGTPFKLLSPSHTFLNISDTTLPNPRVISNVISTDNGSTGNHRNLSELFTFFGQLLDHTLTETENDNTSIPIRIPANDTTFHGRGVIPFFRTHKERVKDDWAPVNLLPSFIDAGAIYGPSEQRSRRLRKFEDGLLRAGESEEDNLLPTDEQGFYMSGDNRANENPALTAMHTLFFREHNRVCGELKKAFPRWGDEKLYHIARKIVGAEMQAIVYYEFLPAVLGHRLKPYTGYRRWVDPRISNEFSTVAYRVGHSLINRYITSISAAGTVNKVELRRAFFKPARFKTIGVDSLLRGMIKTEAAEVDVKVTDAVRNFLVGDARSDLRLDLAALNVQRGRDHAVPHYNAMRKMYGLWAVESFKEITSNSELSARLERVYGDVNLVDAWIGGLAEDHAKGSSLGPLFKRAWIEEFTRLRDGDRLYFRRWGMFPVWWRWRVPTLRRLTGWKMKGGIMRRVILENTDVDEKMVKWNPFMV